MVRFLRPRPISIGLDARKSYYPNGAEDSTKVSSFALSDVKESLTVDQIVHLLCIGAQRTL